MDLISPLGRYLFSLPIKPNYIISSFIVEAGDFSPRPPLFLLLIPVNNLTVHFPITTNFLKMVCYFTNLLPLTISQEELYPINDKKR